MEDKRITKTKRALKSALLKLLTTQAFDVISITELCKIANVSRITFYTHYKDKFALLDDIFNDMLIIGKEGYHRRQEENNPENNLTQGYLNVLDSICLFTMNVMIFSSMSYRKQILTWLFDFIGSS